jgi:tRNA wybutosine-synthesizing protein 1
MTQRVKVCPWTRRALTAQGVCYKARFYGISCHRCLQMTPAEHVCNNRCLHCWRTYEDSAGTEPPAVLAPAELLASCLDEHRRHLTGFRSNRRVVASLLEEALSPSHCAISLSGEPTLYPHIGEYLRICRSAGLTTFLVTNASMPDVIASLSCLPTQLYLSFPAASRDQYLTLCRPTHDMWNDMMRSLELLRLGKCRSALRFTVMKGINVDMPDLFAGLAKRGAPDFIEVKAYSYIGGSTHRLSYDNVPEWAETLEFARRIAALTSYVVTDNCQESKAVLLCRNESVAATRFIRA